MKNKKKKIFIFMLFAVLFFCCSKNFVFAQGEEYGDAALRGNPGYNPTTGTITNPDGTLYGGSTTTSSAYQNQEKIPGASGQTNCFPDYVKQIINFGFATIGILAMFMLAIGAYQYLMSAGNIGSAESAKSTIGSALGGLALGLCAWLILNTINPDLVSMKNPDGLNCNGTTTSTTTTGGSGFTGGGGDFGGGGASGTYTKTSDTTKSTSSDISNVKCDTVRNYSGFMNKNSSDLSNENIKSAQDLENALTGFRKNNNGLTQYSDTIYQACKDNNVPYWYMIGTFAKESSMFSEGTKGCSGYNNPGCMMSNGKYTRYDTPEEGIQANIANMGRLIKNSNTPLEAWNKWYWPDRSAENCAGAKEYLDFFSTAANKTGLSGI